MVQFKNIIAITAISVLSMASIGVVGTVLTASTAYAESDYRPGGNVVFRRENESLRNLFAQIPYSVAPVSSAIVSSGQPFSGRDHRINRVPPNSRPVAQALAGGTSFNISLTPRAPNVSATQNDLNLTNFSLTREDPPQLPLKTFGTPLNFSELGSPKLTDNDIGEASLDF